MPVDSINGFGSDLPLRPASARSAAVTRQSVPAPDSFDTTAVFKAAQNQSQASRPEKLVRAQQLLSDVGYPSDKELNQLAGFFAGKL